MFASGRHRSATSRWLHVL